MNFEDYLQSKKIDSSAFRLHESALWESWKTEFELMHPNSFTAQKLYLINPIRRKYALKTDPVKADTEHPVSSIKNSSDAHSENTVSKPATPKPVFRPKPKMN